MSKPFEEKDPYEIITKEVLENKYTNNCAHNINKICDIIDCRSDIANHKFKFGTLLHLAAKYDYIKLVNKLVDVGADLNITNEYGKPH